MTVSTDAARAGPYTGNDVTSSFSFGFKVFEDSDIRVVETVIATEVESDLVLNTNYTVSRNVDQDNDPGGTITYKVGGVTTALPSTKKLTLVGNFAYEQPSDIPNGGAFQAAVIELALDRTQMQVKQLAEQMDRTVRVAVSSATDPDDLIADLVAAASDAETAAAAAAVSETNAGASATTAAASAASAAAAAASIGYKDVVFLTSANSPYTVTSVDSGKLLSVDTSGGAVTVSLPTISGLTLPFVVGVKKSTTDSNNVTVNRGGSDTFDDGTTSKSLTGTSGLTLIPDTDTAPDVWSTISFGTSSGEQKKQQFTAGVDFTAGSSTTVTITETPIATSKDALEVFFDVEYQQESEWSYSASTGVVTFNSAIPVGVSKIEAKWVVPLSIGTPADGTVSASKLAYSAVNGQTAETAPATDDEVLLGDTSAAALRKMTLVNLLKVINSLTEDTSPDLAADYLLTYDASAGAVKRALAARVARGVLGTAQATTSDTFKDFDIPSWAQKVTVMLNGVSTNGTSPVRLQLASGGSVETSGYESTATVMGVANSTSTGGFDRYQTAAADVSNGVYVLTRVDGNTWICAAQYALAAGGNPGWITGRKTTASALDRIRLTTVGAVDTFDVGSWNILVE